MHSNSVYKPKQYYESFTCSNSNSSNVLILVLIKSVLHKKVEMKMKGNFHSVPSLEWNFPFIFFFSSLMASLSSPNITTITSIDLWDPFAARNVIQHVLLPQVDLDILIYNRVANRMSYNRKRLIFQGLNYYPLYWMIHWSI